MRTDTDSLSASTVFHVSCFRAPSDSLRLTDGNQPSASRIFVSVDSSWLYGLRSDEPLRFPFAHARLNSLWNCDVDTAIPTLLCGLPRVEWNRQGYMGCFLSNERVDLCHISLEFYSSFQSHGSNPFRLAADRAFHFGLSGVV